jgi:hypothetical protein
MSSLAQQFAERVASGLKRKSLTSCSKWAEQYRVMGSKSFAGPWRFKYHPWLREMHDSKAEMNVGQKSAQMGFTEAVLNKVFYEIDINGTDCLYILPAKTPDASDFSAARFDAALQLSPHLRKMFSDVKNVGHKRAGSANLYIRGSRSDSGLKSIPTGFIVLDEVDEMTQENVPLAKERASGQVEKQIWMISTPTIDNFGINMYYRDSTQNHFHFKCPSCNRFIELKFPESFVVTAEELDDPKLKESHYICYECKAKLPTLPYVSENKKPDDAKVSWIGDGIWIPSLTNKDAIGWHVNQMYSCTITPYEMARAFLMAQIDPAAEQEFFKSKLGLPHVVDGARVTDDDIERAKRSYKRGDARPGGIYTMGVDVGKWCHWEICEWFLPPAGTSAVDLSVLAKCRVVTHGKCLEFEELDRMMFDYQIRFCVIDAMPERRKALEFANRHYGRVKLNFYGGGVIGKNIHISEQEPTITVDRTSWMDLSLGRFRNNTIAIPCDVDMEYRAHMKAPVRIYEKDKNGNPIGRYTKGNEDDHYAHARTYAEIALPLAVSLSQSSSILNPY